MSEQAPQTPSLTAFHSVTGIEDYHILGLQHRLNETGYFREDDVQAILQPADALKALIIANGEIVRLYSRLGWEPSKEEITKMAARLEEDLKVAKAADTAMVLPATIEPPKKTAPRKVLTVAYAKAVMRERTIAQTSILDFLGIPKAPKHVWFDDSYVVKAHIARASNPRRVRVLEYLHRAINDESGLLPQVAGLSPIVVERLPRSLFEDAG